MMVMLSSSIGLRLQREHRRLSSTSSSSSVPSESLPVGIFVDLDNITPKTHSREDAVAFTLPLQRFAQHVGTLSTFQAFGNLNTRTYRTAEERERLRQLDGDDWQAYDSQEFHTGRDDNGILRCGVCGAKMRLSKKNKAKGMTERDKLNQHMKLHGNEERKRQSWRKQSKRRLGDKDRQKSQKYQAAQVDYRLPGNRNQLFTVLRERGVQCYPVTDVDAKLIHSAKKWMNELVVAVAAPRSDLLFRGCLVVFSKDSDFGGLMELARSKHILVVSVTPDAWQTPKLEAVSDLVVPFGGDGIPEAYSDCGREFLIDFEEASYDEESSSSTTASAITDNDDDELQLL